MSHYYRMFMPRSIAVILIASSAIFIHTDNVLAHKSYGLYGSHWHPADAWGFVALSVITLVVIWLSRRDK